MAQALFYHLTRSTPEQLLPGLIGKSLETGWRVELRGRDPTRQAALDEALWRGEGFLPHGLAGGPHDARQPVLLTLDAARPGGTPPADPVTPPPPANGAACLVALDGASLAPAECRALERVCIVFDGNDPAALERAREQWRELRAADIPAQYWSETSGRWERRA